MTIRHPIGHSGRCLAGAAVAAALAIAAPDASGADAPARFPALELPALVTPKSAGATMLGLAAAGTRLVAVGERGIVLLSDDRGVSWRQGRVPVSASLTAVRFIDDRRGWAVGHFGTVLRTDDGGESWVKSLDGFAVARLAGQEADQLAAAGDADAERLRAAARQLAAEGPDKPFLDVLFTSPDDGFVVGAYNLAFRTRDGGRSWVPWMPRIENPDGMHLYGIARTGGPEAGAFVIVGEQGTLLRSTDGGERFEPLASPYPGSLFGVLAAARGTLLAYGLRGNLLRSDDGGERWETVESGVVSGLAAGLVLPDGAILLGSQGGDLLLSRDDGRSFRRIARRDMPLTALADAGGGRIVAASLRGVQVIDLPPQGAAR